MRALVLALAIAGWASSGAAAQEIARLDAPTPIDAHAGWLAWSERAPNGSFELVLRDPSGALVRPAVAPRATSFDVDLGPGPDGAVVAAYSRCRSEVGTSGGYLPPDYDEGRGCDAYLLDLTTGLERKLAGLSTDQADETWPSVWRDRVAFVRSYDRTPDLPYLYVRPLAGGRSVRQPGGRRQHCSRSGSGRRTCTDRRVSRPYALDLYGRRLAFGWTYAGTGMGLDTEIRLDTVGGGHARIARQQGGGLTGRVLGWPSADRGRIHYSDACYADTSGCVHYPEIKRYRIRTRTTDGADGPKAIRAHARDGGVTWLLEETFDGADCAGDPPVAGGTCVLRGLRPAFG